MGKLQTAPNPNSFLQLPRFRCLEDYAAYYEHLPGDDGKENMTAELAAVHYDEKSTFVIDQTQPGKSRTILMIATISDEWSILPRSNVRV